MKRISLMKATLFWYFILCITGNLILTHSDGGEVCPPEEKFIHCKCNSSTISCERITNSEELVDLFNYQFPDNVVFDVLKISASSIDSIPSDVFSHIRAINIDISDNQDINCVGEDAFANSEDYVENLSLANNGLREENVFLIIRKLSKLKTLKLFNNRYESIPDYAFANLKTVETIELHNNNITVIGIEAFANLTRLQMVLLTHNQIKTINEYAFSNLPQTHDIYLYANKVETIRDYAFALGPSTHHKDTTKIWLNSNNLFSFSHNSFRGIGRNAILYLFENNMTTFAQHSFGDLLDEFMTYNVNNPVKFGYVDVHGNPIICDCKVKWLIDNRKYLSYISGLFCEPNGKALLGYTEKNFTDCR